VRVLAVSDVCPAAVIGGGERALWELAARLVRRGHSVRLVSRASENGPERLVQAGVSLRCFAADRRSLVRFIATSITGARRAVAEEAGAHGADVLHLHQPLSALGALTSPAGRRLPSLYTFHSPAPLEYRSRRGTSALHRRGVMGGLGTVVLWAIERVVLARATRIHVLSEFSGDLLRRLYRIADDRVVKIPGGAELDRFRPVADRHALRRGLGLPADRPLLLTLRNLEPRMGLDALVRAVAEVRQRRPDVLLLIGGAGSQGAALEALAADLGLGAHVRFLGFVPEADLPRYYAAADAFVLPTRELEGFGLVTVEALACGTPVLGTPVGATPEILTPLDAALLFRDATAEGMAAGLTRFVDNLGRDREAAERLRQACRRHAETFYDWEGATSSLERTLAGLAARGRDLDAVTHRCPVCEGETVAGPERHGQRYLVCRRCRTAVMSSPPTGSALRAYYEVEYPSHFMPDRVEASRQELFTALLGRLGRLTLGRRLLDLGCGGGHLLTAAATDGWRGVGSDVSLDACRTAVKASVGGVIQADCAAVPVRGGAVDAVTLVNVLDHLVEPARTVAEAHRVLGESGVLVIRVTNGAFHRTCLALAHRLRWLGRRTGLDAYPVLHVFAFTADGLRRLVEAAGFDVLGVRNSPLVADGPAWADAAPRRIPRWLRGLFAFSAAAAARLTAGRWLLAPSIELYARRRAAGRGRRR